MGSVKPIKAEPASPGYRRHEDLVQHAAASGAFMPLRGIEATVLSSATIA